MIQCSSVLNIIFAVYFRQKIDVDRILNCFKKNIKTDPLQTGKFNGLVYNRSNSFHNAK